jgi:hypothetical protein
MGDLPDNWLLVIKVLLDSPVAWRKPAEIAAALGQGEEETTDLLCEIDLAGWLVIWDVGEGPVVTLSALAAARLGVRLVEVGSGQTPRWARAGDPDPPSLRSKNVCANERAASFEFVVDEAPPPDLTAELSERVEALQAVSSAQRRAGELPTPTLLLGLGLTPWPGPRLPSVCVCPACGDRTLLSYMYCLYCDRWGLDRPAAGGAEVLPVNPRVRPPRPESERRALERLQAEKLRARRKAQRQRHHQARVESGRRLADSPRSSNGSPTPPRPAAPPAGDFTRPPRAASPAGRFENDR